jgi:hypothetical protein
VWIQAHSDAEPVFIAALARLGGDDLTTWMRAGMINLALRVAVEHYAFTTDGAGDRAGILAAMRAAMSVAAQGL